MSTQNGITDETSVTNLYGAAHLDADPSVQAAEAIRAASGASERSDHSQPGSGGHPLTAATEGHDPDGQQSPGTPQEELLSAALDYAKHGWRIFPVMPPSMGVQNAGKKPAISDWPNQASCDPVQIERWWRIEYTGYNIGLLTGPDNDILVLDVDVDGDADELLGGRPVPATVTQRTGKGDHYLFRWPSSQLEGVSSSKSGLLPRIDTRGQSGFIVATPSTHASGRQYRWAEGCAPDETELAEAPEWLIELLLEGGNRKPRTHAAAETDDGIPRPLNPAQLISALDHIDQNALDYDDWLRIIMALHHESRGSEDGLLIADQWSQQGERYEEGEVAQRWGGFGEHEQPTTQDTIFKWAMQGGWSGEYRQSEDLLPWVRYERARRFLQLGQHYGIVDLAGKTRVVYRNWDGNRACWSTGFMSRSDFEALKANEFVPKETRRANRGLVIRREEAAKAWFHSPKRKTYTGVKLEPKPGLVAGDKRLPDPAEEPQINLYQGLAISPRPGECIKLHRHIREVICQEQEDAYEYLLNWLARMFQRPDLPGETVPVLQSSQGAGKNIFIEPLVKAFGEHGVAVSNSEGLVGQFQDQIAHAVLVFANEALWGGDKKKEGQLKALITDETREVNRKFVPQYTVRNYVHLIVASNESWPVPTGAEDRRFVFYRLSDERIGDRAYFNELSAEIDAGGIEAFVHELLERDISDFHPGNRPKDVGDARFAAVLKSEDSRIRWWYACLSEGRIQANPHPGINYPQDYAAHGAPNGKMNNWREDEIVIPKDVLRRSYSEWALQRHERLEEADFTKFLNKVCRDKRDCRPHLKEEDRRVQCYVLPSLVQCRFLFEQHLGQEIDWSEETETEEDGDTTSVQPPISGIHAGSRENKASEEATKALERIKR